MSLASYKSQVYNEATIDLKSFNLETDISTFYANSLNQDHLNYKSNKQYVQKESPYVNPKYENTLLEITKLKAPLYNWNQFN